jgi:hypothetical protein
MAELSGEGTLSVGGQPESSWDVVKKAEEARLADRRSKAAKWLNEKWIVEDKRCPICHSQSWIISDIVELRQFHDGALRLNDSVYPIFMNICSVCGYSMVFNAAIAGIITTPAAPQPGSQEDVSQQGQAKP